MSELKHFVICENDCKIEGMTKEQIIAAIAEATGNTPTLAGDAFITQIVNQNGGNLKLWRGTNAQYNAIEHEADTYYIITDSKTADEAYNKALEAEAAARSIDAMPKSGGTFTGAAMAAANAEDGAAVLRNIVVVEAGTDLATLSVPAGTIILEKK